MICLAVVVSNQPEFTDGNALNQQKSQIRLYREKIVQCLIVGEYTKPEPYVLEILINYNYVEMRFRPDSMRDTWFLFGLEVSLAKRMGYQRDPSHFPSISPLQGEMRRRLWATILLGDTLIPSQMGLPRMILDMQCDTGATPVSHRICMILIWTRT
jgi:hypothetical protein